MTQDWDALLAEAETQVRALQDQVFESYKDAAAKALLIPDERARFERIAQIDRDCRELCYKVSQPLRDIINMMPPRPIFIHDPARLP